MAKIGHDLYCWLLWIRACRLCAKFCVEHTCMWQATFCVDVGVLHFRSSSLLNTVAAVFLAIVANVGHSQDVGSGFVSVNTVS